MEARLYEPPEDDGIEITQEMLDAGVSRSMDFEEDYRDSEECIAEIYRAMRKVEPEYRYELGAKGGFVRIRIPGTNWPGPR